MNPHEDAASDFNRRDFLKGTSLATLMAVMGGVPLRAEDAKPAGAPKKATNPPVNCAVIGCGLRGRDILNTLALMPNAPVVAVCDHYAPFLNRAKSAAPKAEGYTDYKQLLANKDVQAVLIATPTHLHREITLAALQAGKHVYLEAPLAHSLDDARAIARAAQSALKSNFQSGLQMRSDPQRHFLLQFIRSGAAGKPISARAQWHKKESWRRTSPSPEREQELNWRLSNATSNGLIAEVGLHQIDVLGWFLKELPMAVTGFGGVRHWTDGRDVPDSIQATFEFPSGTLLNYDATLANSFDADYEMLYGTDRAVTQVAITATIVR